MQGAVNSHEMALFEHICTEASGTLKRVDIVHGRISVRTAKSGEFLMWQEEEMGGFRKFPTEASEWSNVDVRKFSLMLRGPTAFFVVIHKDHVQIFPSRSSLS